MITDNKMPINNCYKFSHRRTMSSFLVCVLLADAVAFIAIFVTGGGLLSSLIWNGETFGIFPDFFETLMNAEYLRPYSDGAIYPAFVYLVFYPLSKLTGFGIHSIGFTASSITQRGSIIGIYFFLIFTILYWIILSKIADANQMEKVAILAVLLMSPGYIYLIDRGNIVIMTATMIAAFLYLYLDNNSGAFRYQRLNYFISICFLCFAVCMKLYPVLFGLILLKKRDWKNIRNSLIVLSCTFFFPFFAIREDRPIHQMIYNIFYLNGGNAHDSRGFGYGYMVSITTIMRACLKWLGWQMPSWISRMVEIIACGVIIFIAIMSSTWWKRIMAITVGMIILPGFSWIYNDIYLFLPLMFYFKEEPFIKKGNIRYFILFMICVACLPYGYVMRSLPGANKMSVGTLIEATAMTLMVLIVFIETCFETNKKLLLFIKKD